MDVETRASQVIPRRTLAKGAMWAVPAVAAAAAAPTFAASPGYYAGICTLTYGAHDGMSGPRHTVWLIAYSTNPTNKVIPVGTTFQWTFNVTPLSSAATWKVPLVNGDAWEAVTVSPATGTNMTGAGSFTVTFRITTAHEPVCNEQTAVSNWRVEWSDRYPLPSQTTISITSSTTAGTAGGPSTLTYITPNRNQNPGMSNLEPHYYVSRSGFQVCWPVVAWTTYNYNWQNGEDNVSCYPAGTTVIPTSERCTWNDSTGSCTPNPAGLCSPKFTNTSNNGDQWVQPKIC